MENNNMKTYVLPDEINRLVKAKEYKINDIGMSDSEVRIYDDYVLKIHPCSDETDNEYAVVKWLAGKVQIPAIPAYCVKNGVAFTLMSKIEGKMLSSNEYIENSDLVIQLVAQGLKQLWKTDVKQSPCQISKLSERLKAAEYNVLHDLVDIDNAEPKTFGVNGFKDPKELLNWLMVNQPDEDIVLTHGDYCLPNIFAIENNISGYIDLGKMGPADRWQDIAIAIRSLDHNFDGRYSNGKRIFDFKAHMLLEKLGIEFDKQKYQYYILLDELF